MSLLVFFSFLFCWQVNSCYCMQLSVAMYSLTLTFISLVSIFSDLLRLALLFVYFKAVLRCIFALNFVYLTVSGLSYELSSNLKGESIGLLSPLRSWTNTDQMQMVQRMIQDQVFLNSIMTVKIIWKTHLQLLVSKILLLSLPN